MAKQTISFTPKARLIKILGEHLIKDATVGLLELVKNSYDADATYCEIKMISLNKPGAKIIISDNGSGMDLETFLKKWMNPATGHKEEQKKLKERTNLGRLPLGEKGVGRFAAQQIGNNLTLISKSKTSNQEVYVEIDWKRFENNKLDLRDVEIEYKLQIPKYFTVNSESGVILEITDLKYNWTEQNIKNISGVLKRMKSPFKTINDFDIKLVFENCPPEFTLYEDLELTDILEKAHYKLYGIVDKEGILDFEYISNIPGEPKQRRDGKFNLKEFGKAAELIENIECGDFIFNFYHYNKDWDKKSGFNKKDIEELSGVSIFRDGIRILPYGEKGNDWLGLDSKRVQDSSFIGNDTIIGLVEIDQLINTALIDKANREGLIENNAYKHLNALVFTCVQFLHKEKNKEKKKEKKIDESKKEISNNLDKIKQDIDASTNKLSRENSELDNQTIQNLTKVKESVENVHSQFTEAMEEIETSNKRFCDVRCEV
jgi:hypothetical protein